ncbi:MAG: hypothetical protein ACR2NT_12640 [Acidimicrobiia bacterium]
MGEVSTSRLDDEAVLRAAVERFVTRLVYLAVDVNSHISVGKLGRVAANYRSSFTLAAEQGHRR